MSRLAADMKGVVVLGVYRSTVKKQNKDIKTSMYVCCVINPKDSIMKLSLILN